MYEVFGFKKDSSLRLTNPHDVIVVNAVPQDLEVIKGNANVSNTISSITTQVSFLGTYVAKNHFYLRHGYDTTLCACA